MPVDIIWVLIACGAVAILSALSVKFLDRLRKKDAESEAKTIVDQAERIATDPNAGESHEPFELRRRSISPLVLITNQ